MIVDAAQNVRLLGTTSLSLQCRVSLRPHLLFAP